MPCIRNSGSDQVQDRRDSFDRPIHSPFFVPTISTASPISTISSSLRSPLRLSLYDPGAAEQGVGMMEGRQPYETDADASATMAADERIHGEVLRGLATRGRERLSGTFRAAVFGANDGLVSNLALVLGIGATGVDTRTVLFTGIAGLLAGALSMAAGEYVSVRSQRELLQSTQPDPESQSALPHLDVDANELALVYRARGMEPPEAEAHARTVLATLHLDPDATDVAHVDPHQAVGSAWGAAISSFGFFASGALIPVLPYLLGASGLTAVVIAAVLVGISLLGTGAVVGILSGASPLKRALRQLGIGYGAAAATYLLGLAFGATLG